MFSERPFLALLSVEPLVVVEPRIAVEPLIARYWFWGFRQRPLGGAVVPQ